MKTEKRTILVDHTRINHINLNKSGLWYGNHAYPIYKIVDELTEETFYICTNIRTEFFKLENDNTIWLNKHSNRKNIERFYNIVPKGIYNVLVYDESGKVGVWKDRMIYHNARKPSKKDMKKLKISHAECFI